jgi:hypothetical protein
LTFPVFEYNCNIMSDQKHNTPEIIKRYLKDLVHSFNTLSTGYTPLQTDPKEAGFPSIEPSLHGRSHRGMGIVEAHSTLKRFVLIGDPGAGKSTALQYLSLNKAQELLDDPSKIAAIGEGITFTACSSFYGDQFL